MNQDQGYYDFHLLICTNARDNGKADCASKGSMQMVEELKKWAKSQNFSKKIRIQKAGCLDRCAHGVAAVAYPKGEWILDATTQDLDAMKKFITERAQ